MERSSASLKLADLGWYARLNLAGLHDLDYRTKTFRCSRCGGEAYLAVVEPIKETGMGDYRLDEVATPERHPTAVDRLTGRRRPPQVDHSGGNCRAGA
jgi:hypothetical protein